MTPLKLLEVLKPLKSKAILQIKQKRLKQLEIIMINHSNADNDKFGKSGFSTNLKAGAIIKLFISAAQVK